VNDVPNVTNIGDGLRMIETRDREHCYRKLEPDGKVSVIIALGSPPRPPKPDVNEVIMGVFSCDQIKHSIQETAFPLNVWCSEQQIDFSGFFLRSVYFENSRRI